MIRHRDVLDSIVLNMTRIRYGRISAGVSSRNWSRRVWCLLHCDACRWYAWSCM